MTDNQIDNYNALQKQNTENRKLIKKLQLDKQALKEQLSLYGVGCSFILKEINKQIDNYNEDHSHCNIVSCDVNDVYKWMKKAENKLKKRLAKK
tara:strand:+ start:102 stop:383 length:282 start_codon:yes stop_codon:yes gene_type:complete